jgi:hypothetical protein
VARPDAAGRERRGRTRRDRHPRRRPAIRIAYGFTAVQLALANAAFVRNQRSSQVFGLLAVAIVGLNLLTLNDPLVAGIGIVLAVLFLTGGLVAPFTWWSMRSKQPLLQHIEATIDDAGIASNWPGGSGILGWPGVDRIEHGGRWFFVRSSAAATALVLPEAAFGPGEVEAFRAVALRHGFTLDGHRVDPPRRPG